MRFRLHAFIGALLAAGVAVADPVSKTIPEPPPAAAKPDRPTSVDELKEIQAQVRAVTDKVIPVTVCLQVGNASGSGVIVNEDGLILTAGHVVAGKPGRSITVVMPDGKRYKGKVLGFDPKIDSGMAQLTEKPEGGGKWPYAEVAPSKEVKGGQWVIAVGHPGGFKKDRPPVVRVGRVGRAAMPSDGSSFMQTDCTLVGGDSGGPLFDMKGRVIGIHSRIGQPINQNLDVPSDKFTEAWDGLKSETVLGVTPFLGVGNDEKVTDGCKLGRVTVGGPAAQAGIKAGDTIIKFGGKEVATYDDMVKLLKEHKPYEEVEVEVRREVKKDDKKADAKDKKDEKESKTDDKDKKDEKKADPETEIKKFKVTIGYRAAD